MRKIYIIDTDTKENVGFIDFIPHREERIIVSNKGRNLEYKVRCVVHYPSNNCILIFSELVNNYYESMIKNIKW